MGSLRLRWIGLYLVIVDMESILSVFRTNRDRITNALSSKVVQVESTGSCDLEPHDSRVGCESSELCRELKSCDGRGVIRIGEARALPGTNRSWEACEQSSSLSEAGGESGARIENGGGEGFVDKQNSPTRALLSFRDDCLGGTSIVSILVRGEGGVDKVGDGGLEANKSAFFGENLAMRSSIEVSRPRLLNSEDTRWGYQSNMLSWESFARRSLAVTPFSSMVRASGNLNRDSLGVP